MSLAEIEKQVLGLSDEDRQKFNEWFLQDLEQVTAVPAEHRVNDESLTDAMKAELRLRKQDYLDHPERFRRVATEAELKEYFNEIRDEVRTRFSSAG